MRTMSYAFRKMVLPAAIALALAGGAEAACTVSNLSMSFGVYSYVNATPLDATGTLGITCTPDTFVTISIGPSANTGGYANRQMVSPGSAMPLNYNIYSDKKRATVWGDGADSITVRSNKSINVYGRIPTGQNVPSGFYGDTLTITVTP